MSKKITSNNFDYPEIRSPWGGDNQAPYNYMKKILCQGKTREECKIIEQKIKESFTYLLICERGCITPMMIEDIYNAEQKDGLVGFMKELLYQEPCFMENPVSDFILDKENSQEA